MIVLAPYCGDSTQKVISVVGLDQKLPYCWGSVEDECFHFNFHVRIGIEMQIFKRWKWKFSSSLNDPIDPPNCVISWTYNGDCILKHSKINLIATLAIVFVLNYKPLPYIRQLMSGIRQGHSYIVVWLRRMTHIPLPINIYTYHVYELHTFNSSWLCQKWHNQDQLILEVLFSTWLNIVMLLKMYQRHTFCGCFLDANTYMVF